MKNVHILSTDKPSRLHLAYDKYYYLSVKPFTQLYTKNYKSFHIYITSDEEIKERDWYLTFLNKEVIGKPRKCEDSNWNFSGCKKIILTTDTDLIKDGVQAIDDDFLEWFVKNPSCDEVKVKYDKDIFPYGVEISNGYGWYKIIIPKEEPKQETLEEAAEREYAAEGEDSIYCDLGLIQQDAFIEGAKWQSERMYSEQEAYAIWKAGKEYWRTSGASITFEELLEQFKKK